MLPVAGEPIRDDAGNEQHDSDGVVLRYPLLCCTLFDLVHPGRVLSDTHVVGSKGQRVCMCKATRYDGKRHMLPRRRKA